MAESKFRIVSLATTVAVFVFGRGVTGLIDDPAEFGVADFTLQNLEMAARIAQVACNAELYIP